MKRFLTRIVVLLITAVMTLCFFTGCNEDLGFGNYSFNKAHIYCGGDGNGTCVEISSWHDNEIGVELKLKDNKGSVYCSEGTYILVENYCPICGK